jgi:hypothetical protein
LKGGDKVEKQDIYLRLYLSAFKSGLVAQLPATDFKVFLAICSYMNEAGECYPSIQQIANLTGISKRTVQRSIKELLDFRFQGKPILTRQLVKEGNQFLRSNYKVNPISQVAIFNGEIESV